MYRYIVCIGARFSDEDAPAGPIGTGCVIGCKLRAGKRYPIVMTAGHVIEHDLRDQTEWKLVRLRTPDMPERVASFRTPEVGVEAPEVIRYCGEWYRGKHAINPGPQFDIGALVFPNDACPEGFLSPDEPTPLVLPTQIRLAIGTRVAWAGYPKHVMQLLGSPHLCYFEGVISTVVDSPKLPPMYLIDGHNAPGLSGSPLWWWNEQEGRAQVAGVITHYSAADRFFPGMVHASMMNPLMAHLEQTSQGDEKGNASQERS